MVTLLRPHRLAHGPAAVDVCRLYRSSSPQPPPPPSCRCSALRSMAQDPSHPHRQSKDTAAPPEYQQPEKPELTAQQQTSSSLPAPPRDVVQEPSTSSSSGGGSDTGRPWLHLGIGSSSGSPPPSRRKRPRTDQEAGPSTSSVHPATADPQLYLSVHPPGPSSSSPAASSVGTVVAAAPPPPAHEAGTWFVLRAAQNQ
ncbi:hypothetical protein GUJ93_ZPchr0012g20234 [Zizania palustris]|uniref:Uncharacterized protein n=1 Tax=Zizania palustris TaxID=103762 RepID=A0A8J6BUH9_ZIZPA|nr:hypothetical protein GUJ93_ZPchr0012g20234 [Zizania palustris]